MITTMQCLKNIVCRINLQNVYVILRLNKNTTICFKQILDFLKFSYYKNVMFLGNIDHVSTFGDNYIAQLFQSGNS